MGFFQKMDPFLGGADRIHVCPTPFSAISLLQAAHARNTPPPWWHMGQVAEGRVAGGRAGRQVGWAGGWRGLGLAGWWAWWLAGWPGGWWHGGNGK